MSKNLQNTENPFLRLKMPPALPIKVTPKQYGGQKAKFTKAMEILETTITEIAQDAGHVTTQAERDKLKKYLLQTEEAIDKIQEFLDTHAEHESAQIQRDENYVDDELKAQADDFDEKHKKFVEIQTKIQKMVRKFDQDVEKAKLDAQSRRRGQSQSRSPTKKGELPKFVLSRDDDKFRLSDALKPDRLSHEATYLDFLNWEKNANSYAEINAISSKPHKVQVSALNNIIDVQLENHLSVQFNGVEEAPVFSEQNNSYMSSIKMYFQIKYPRPMRIFDYITASQSINESGPAWSRRVEGLAIAAEAHNLTADEWLKFKVVTGMEHKQVLRDKLLLKCNELDLAKIKEKINEDAATEAMAKSLEKSSTVFAVSQYSKDKTNMRYQGYRQVRQNQPQFRQPQQQHGPRGPQRFGMQQQQRQQPPFQPRGQQGTRPKQNFDLKCRVCGFHPYWNCRNHFKGDVKKQIEKYGHLVRGQGTFNQLEEDENTKDVSDFAPDGFVNKLFTNYVCANDVTMISAHDKYNRDRFGLPLMPNTRATPLTYVRVKQLNAPPPTEFSTTNPTTEVLAMFDTGATQSLMHIKLADECVIREIDHDDRINILTANHGGINVIGSVRLLIEYFGMKVREKVYICEGITDTHVFLSWQCAIALQVVPREYPLPLQHCNLEELERPIHNPFYNPAAIQANFVNAMEEANIQLQRLRIQNGEIEPRLAFSDENNDCVALEHLNKLFESYSIVFNTSVKKDIQIPKMKLRYRKDIPIVPYKCTSAIPTPYALREAARAEINGYVKDGIIAKVQPHEQIVWCAKSMFVAKEVAKTDGARHDHRLRQHLKPPSVRLVLDNRYQNKYLERDPYPFQSPKELAKSLPPSASVFIVVDLWKGYYQCPLEDEDQIDTTFMVHEMGCYKFLRAPQGCALSGDHFNRVTESLIEGIRGCIKLIDDILIFGQTIAETFHSFEQLLKRCKEKEFTLHPKKVQIGNKVTFAGFVITPNGISIDERKVIAIRDFKRPLSVTDMKSFVGLAVQFKESCPNLMGILKPLMDTTSTKVTPAIDEKGRKIKNSKRIIEWTPTLEEAFLKTKQALTNADGQVLAQYDPSLPLVIYTDASRLNGYGWVATQTTKEGQKKLIECGSATISESASRNFSVTELELMAIVIALKKMRLMTEGNTQIEVKTDHLPLVGLHSKPLDKMETKRLMKMMEKLSSFTYTVSYINGVRNEIADCLSRYPRPEKAEEEIDVINSLQAINEANYSQMPLTIHDIKKAASDDQDYQSLVKAIKDGIRPRNLPPQHAGRMYKSDWHMLGTDDNLVTMDDRILVPRQARKDLLNMLHRTHLGFKKMFYLASQLYFWHGMRKDISQVADVCEECNTVGNFKPKETLRPQFASRPMEMNAVDLAEYGKKSYLVHADRYSGYLWVYPLKGQTSSEVQTNLWRTFRMFGYPEKLQSDNGGQFSSDSFTTRCKNDGIVQVFISPLMSQSNGFIEKFVHITKNMIKKAKNQEHLAEMVMDYNQASNSSGLSPSQILMKTNVRTRLPMLKSAFRTISDEEIEKAIKEKNDAFKKQEQRFNRDARDLPELQIGQLVRIYNFKTRQWDLKAEIINKDVNRSYQLRTKNSTILWRNRRFVKEITRGLTEFDQTSAGRCLASSAAFKSSSSFRSLNFKNERLRRRRR